MTSKSIDVRREVRILAASIALLAAFIPSSLFGQTDSVLQKAIQEKEHRLEWWRKARFGMFIHWGPVSLERNRDKLVSRRIAAGD